MSYQDVITTKEEIVKVIYDENISLLLRNSRYHPIIVALRKGPMTVRDLEIEYNKIITKDIDEMELTTREKTELKQKMWRKSKTLYKYLDVLIKNNLVIEVGRRIKKGQTASETLYGRASKLFIENNKTKTSFSDESSQRMMPILAKIICKEKNIPEIDLKCLTEAFQKVTASIGDKFTTIFQEQAKTIIDTLSTSSFDDITNLSEAVILILYLFNGEKFEKLIANCIK
ncbi:MAG: hypothetical protein ACTSSH_08170 [Candidatus Heimdallarchaeota archaeon]